MHERKTVKQLLEEIDEAELEFGRDEVELKGMLAKAKAAKRDLTATESAQWEATLRQAQQTKQRLAQLRTELTEEQNRERQIVKMSRTPNAIVYGNSYSGDGRVLPTDGILPDGNRPRYQPFNRMGKLRAFKSEQEAFDAGQWMKAVVCREFRHGIDKRAEDYCNNIGMEITNVGYEGSGPAGGYLVPAPLSAAIIEVRERVGVSRQVCSVQPTGSDTLSIPKRAGGLTVYYPTEGSLITDSDKLWAMVSLAVIKRAVASYLTQELVDDALISITDNVILEMAHALALQEDNELINGTGASTYGGVLGLLSAIGSAGVYTCDANENLWSEIDLEDMTATIGKLPDRYFPYEPSWICSHSFFNQVMMRLAFAAGGVTASEVMGGTPNVRSFLGYKVYLTSKMPTAQADSTKCVLFGAWSQAVILADRGGVRIGRSDEYKFLEDKVTLRATARYDIKVHDRGDASNAGAYVALSTNAA